MLNRSVVSRIGFYAFGTLLFVYTGVSVVKGVMFRIIWNTGMVPEGVSDDQLGQFSPVLLDRVRELRRQAAEEQGDAPDGSAPPDYVDTIDHPVSGGAAASRDR